MRGLMLVFSLHFGPDPSGDAWFAADKAKHFFTAALAQSMAFGGLRSVGVRGNDALIGATAVSGAVSVGKELYDLRTGGDASFKDLAWDAVGIASMTVLLRRTPR